MDIITNKDLSACMDFLITIDQMKNILRRTVNAGSIRRENDAEHSWHIAMFIMTLKQYAAFDFDEAHAVELAVVHDLIEIYAGDTFAYDEKGNLDKKQREADAEKKLFSMLPDDVCEKFTSLFDEFEACETPEARVANACDRIQPFMYNYITEGHTWLLGQVKRAQVEKRIAITREVFPALNEFIDGAIAKAMEKDWIKNE